MTGCTLSTPQQVKEGNKRTFISIKYKELLTVGSSLKILLHHLCFPTPGQWTPAYTHSSPITILIKFIDWVETKVIFLLLLLQRISTQFNAVFMST